MKTKIKISVCYCWKKNTFFSTKTFSHTNTFFLNLPCKQSSLTDQLSIKLFPEVYMPQFERGGVVDSKWGPERRGERISCSEKYIYVLPCHTQHSPSYQGPCYHAESHIWWGTASSKNSGQNRAGSSRNYRTSQIFLTYMFQEEIQTLAEYIVQ